MVQNPFYSVSFRDIKAFPLHTCMCYYRVYSVEIVVMTAVIPCEKHVCGLADQVLIFFLSFASRVALSSDTVLVVHAVQHLWLCY